MNTNYLSRLSLLKLRLRLLACQSGEKQTPGPLSPVFISSEEVMEFLDCQSINTSVEEHSLYDEIQEKQSEIQKEGKGDRIGALTGIFGLSDWEEHVLTMAWATETDRGFQRVYAFLQDDLSRKLPSVDIANRSWLCGEKKLEGNGMLLHSRSLLIVYGLVEVVGDAHEPWINKGFHLSERIRDFLLGDDFPTMDIASSIVLEMPRQSPFIIFKKDWGHWSQKVPGVIWLYGLDNSGKKERCREFAAGTGQPLIRTSWNDIVKQNDIPSFLKMLCREVLLQQGFLCIEDGDEINTREGEHVFQLLCEYARKFSILLTIIANRPWIPDSVNIPWHIHRCDSLSYGDMKIIWQRSLEGFSIQEKEIEMLSTLPVLPEYIPSAIAQAMAEGIAKTLNVKKIQSALSQCHVVRQNPYIQRIEPKYTWQDIVLPEDKLKQLQQICEREKHRYTVYTSWKFHTRRPHIHGLNIFFSGPSGTGKSMSSEILANELGIQIFRVNLGTVVSKYIGETEKNLHRIFQEFQNSYVLLFFDEADALFSKRTEVKDSHDRYANLETNFLLQQIDEYQGMVILASNVYQNIDTAFLRRMDFRIEFSEPDFEQRLGIWKNSFPPQAPIDKDIDWEMLAKNLEITGGNIKNIALSCAFMAASENRQISMDHILAAVKQEYQKTDKTLFPEDIKVDKNDC